MEKGGCAGSDGRTEETEMKFGWAGVREEKMGFLGDGRSFISGGRGKHARV